MKILLILGSYPPDCCGVGDYSKSLSDEIIKSETVDILVIRDKCTLTDLVKIYNQSKQYDIVNIQVPALHFEGRLISFLIPLTLIKSKLIITCHEFVRRSLYGKLLMFLSFLIAKQVIFTTKVEYYRANRWYPFLKQKYSIIPIGSSINESLSLQNFEYKYDICYFGLIRDGKGIESFIEIVRKISYSRKIKILFCGMIPPEFINYFDKVKDELMNLNCEIQLNKSSDEVACLIKQTKLSLLPFPDGISARRSSALACMMNQSLLVTTPSLDIDEQEIFKTVALIGENNDELATHCLNALQDYQDFDNIKNNAYLYASNLSWKGIAKQYLRVFETA